jgi:hypothetical protein
MKKKTLRMLSASEQELLRQTEPEALEGLDEEALLALHTRVRRARTKYATLYRRRSSAQVKADRSRGRASATHARTARKAEVFEKALARVSRRLAKAAKARSDELREERLAAARAVKGSKGNGKGGGKRKAKAPSQTKKLSSAKAQQRTPARKRSSAQSRASTRRHQAARASR